MFSEADKSGEVCKICQGPWEASDPGLAVCAVCDQVVHQVCDQQHISSLQGAPQPYSCPECRLAEQQGLQLAEQQALQLIAQYEQQLRQTVPVGRPRTSYEIFTVDMHRIHSEEAGLRVAPAELTRIISEAWGQLLDYERGDYEDKAQTEASVFQAELQQYSSFYTDYVRLCSNVGRAPAPHLAPAAVLSALEGQGSPVPGASPAHPPPLSPPPLNTASHPGPGPGPAASRGLGPSMGHPPPGASQQQHEQQLPLDVGGGSRGYGGVGGRGAPPPGAMRGQPGRPMHPPPSTHAQPPYPQQQPETWPGQQQPMRHGPPMQQQQQQGPCPPGGGQAPPHMQRQPPPTTYPNHLKRGAGGGGSSRQDYSDDDEGRRSGEYEGDGVSDEEEEEEEEEELSSGNEDFGYSRRKGRQGWGNPQRKRPRPSSSSGPSPLAPGPQGRPSRLGGGGGERDAGYASYGSNGGVGGSVGVGVVPGGAARQGGYPVGGGGGGAGRLERTPGGSRPAGGAPGFTPAQSIDDLPAQVMVSCGGIRGLFVMDGVKVVCCCAACMQQPPEKREYHPTHWEHHCGAGTAKKWKASIKIEPGGAAEVPIHASAMPIGRYFDLKGVEFKPARTLGGPPVLEYTGLNLNKAGGAAAAAPNGPTRPPYAPPGPRRPASSGFGGRGGPAAAGGLEPGAARGGGAGAGGGGPTPPAVWIPWNDVQLGHYTPIKVRWAGDRCCVCDSDVDYDCDQLVSCDGCGITVHQSCYGIVDLPGHDDMWLCRACEHKEKTGSVAQCCLCPIAGGALKATNLEGGQWCHAACMQWIPEVTCADPSRMEPIIRIEHIQKERWELVCCCCKQRMGAKIQCSQCYAAYHPLCARMAGLAMEMADVGNGGQLQIVSYCPRHCKPQPELSGMQRVREQEKGGGGGGGEEHGLWNAQPFPGPPAVPLPACAAGCARAQSLAQVERATHGTGAGCTSLKGFWMPEEPRTPPGALMGPDGLPPPGQGGARGGRPRSRTRAGSLSGLGGGEGGLGRGKSARSNLAANFHHRPASARSDSAPPKVALTPLPPGLPDRVLVACSGRVASFLLRSQRVVYEGQEISASRFEQLCGRGDAKKWKNSIWYVGPAGEPECTMHDWLQRHHLDRSALGALAANAAAADAYQEWLAAQGKAGDPPGPEAGAEGGGGEEEEGEQQEEEERGQEEERAGQQQQQEGEMGGVREGEGGDKAAMAGAAGGESGLGQGQGGASTETGAPAAGDAAAGGAGAGAPPTAPPPVVMRLLRPSGPELDELRGPPPPPAPGLTLVILPPGQVLEGGSLQGPQAGGASQGQAPVVLPPGSSRTQPEMCVGHCCRVFWPADLDWYAADVVAYGDPSSAHPGQHQLWYFLDEQSEWLDLGVEEEGGRLQWLPQVDASFWPPPPPNPPLLRPALLNLHPPGAQLLPPPSEYLPMPPPHQPPPPLAQQQQQGPGHGPGRGGEGPPQPAGTRAGPGLPGGVSSQGEAREGRVGRQKDAAAAAAAGLVGEQGIRGGDEPDGFNSQHQASLLALAAAAESPPPRAPGSRTGQGQGIPLPAGPQQQGGGGRRGAESLEGEGEEAQQEEEEEAPKKDVPQTVDVVCNGLKGVFLVDRMEVRVADGRSVSGTEFERMAGRGAAKKWKVSMRLLRPDGLAGITIQDWMIEHGLEAQRNRGGQAAAAAAAAAASGGGGKGAAGGGPGAVSAAPIGLEALRRRTTVPLHLRRPEPTASDDGGEGSGGGAGGGGPTREPPSRQPRVHRPGCMCIICKQQRAAGTLPLGSQEGAGGGGGPGGATGAPAAAAAAAAAAGGAGRQVRGPALRSGKRAYVRAVPHLVAGLRRHKWWSLPKGKAHLPDSPDWAALRASQPPEEGEEAAGEVLDPLKTDLDQGQQQQQEGGVGGLPGVKVKPEPGAAAAAAGGNLPSAALPPLPGAAAGSQGSAAADQARQAQGSGTGTASLLQGAGPASTEGGTAGGAVGGAAGVGAGVVSLAAGASTGSGGSGLLKRPVTQSERLKHCRSTEGVRLTFGKSGIHGWGMFALEEHAPDSLVAEYRGDALRPIVADMREKRYHREGRDCFLFKLPDDVVVDSTNAGTYSRFTNHCCQPALYTKVIHDAAGNPHLGFFARSVIRAGQELTFDYRFKEEENSKVRCQCGAPNCKGFLC